MMELKEREEIIKALECCSVWENCDGCPYRNSVALGCTSKMMRAALALIKELTEENERLRWISAHVCVEDIITSEHMEELRMAHTLPGMHGDPVGEIGKCGMRYQCVADTVQKMQEKILAKSEYGTINISSWQLGQIAKEVLEENNV